MLTSILAFLDSLIETKTTTTVVKKTYRPLKSFLHEIKQEDVLVFETLNPEIPQFIKVTTNKDKIEVDGVSYDLPSSIINRPSAFDKGKPDYSTFPHFKDSPFFICFNDNYFIDEVRVKKKYFIENVSPEITAALTRDLSDYIVRVTSLSGDTLLVDIVEQHNLYLIKFISATGNILDICYVDNANIGHSSFLAKCRLNLVYAFARIVLLFCPEIYLNSDEDLFAEMLFNIIFVLIKNENYT